MVSDIAISRLMASLTSWEYWGYWSVAAVAVCCLGEYVHECTCWFRQCSWWKKNGGAASALLLVVALAAELAIQIQTNSISGRIIGILSDQAKQAELETARLNAEVAPRRLNPDQERSIIATLANFPGQTVQVSSYELDVDGTELGLQLLRDADAAHLPTQPKLMSQGALGGMLVGISVTGTNVSLVTAVGNALMSFGLHPTPEPPPPTSGQSMGGQGVPFPLKIFVGAKPLPDMPPLAK